MKFYPFIGIFLLLVMSKTSNAQQIKPNSYNYGRVKLWNSPEASFTIKNTSDKSMLILPLPYDHKLRVDLPEGYIKPGESAEIKVRYYTEQTGTFNVRIPVYINTSPIPFELEMKGHIKSLHPNALTQCPTIDKRKNMTVSESPGSITVYDKKTGQVLKGVDILLENSAKSYLLEGTKIEMVPLKKVNIGMYNVVVSKEGYLSQEKIIYVNRNSGDFVFELDRSTNFNSNHVMTGEKNVEFIELLPEDDTETNSIERVRNKMNEKFKGKRIIEKDVVVIKENPFDSATIVNTADLKKSEMFIPPSEQPDFNQDGSLNANKFSFNNIVFIIDVSGSMYREDKLPLLKESMKSMIQVLRKEDLVTIISYSSKPTTHASGVSGTQKEYLIGIIDSLEARGNSYGAEGMIMAYEYAQANYIVGGNNQVILASDGMFNSKEYTQADILTMATNSKARGIRTSTIFFGKSKGALSFMKDLSRSGQGNNIEISVGKMAESALIDEIKQNSIKR